jgi:hypothetical protein
MVPEDACHVTALFDAEPATVAVNEIVASVLTDVVAGETLTDVTDCGTGGAVTVTVAVPTLVGSAMLVAVTIDVSAIDGAV